jgi:RNA polymerase sigma-70 factor, ECF subfamily
MRIRRRPFVARPARLTQAERAAFEADALAMLDSLYRTARRLARSASDAEDLVQETYLKALRAADRFEPGTNLKAWLFTILHNSARNRVRDRARDQVTVDSDTVDRALDQPSRDGGAPDTPETLLLRRTLAPDLQAAIDELPAQFREAVWLRDVEEFSYAEISNMLSIPVGTVMSRISRGRAQLYEKLTAGRAAAGGRQASTFGRPASAAVGQSSVPLGRSVALLTDTEES